MGSDPFAEALTRVRALGAQPRTVGGMQRVLAALARGKSIDDACAETDVTRQTMSVWRKRYEPFAVEAQKLINANEKARQAASIERKRARAESAVHIRSDREVRDPGSLTQFRWDYFGRPTPPHQEALIAALEDLSNLVVIALGPTGMGKDTIAGDYLGRRLAPDDGGLRCAWFMESKDFSERRFGRLGRYLTDPKAYERKPSKTPGGQAPTRSLIEDYGPFRWEKGMVHEDGSKVERTQWTQHQMYFARVVAPEQDPNLWATGVKGSTYGSRIDECVCSDIFTLENQDSPTEREKQWNWLMGTLETRLDEAGRLVHIGTMLPNENNNERMLTEYTAGGRVLTQQRFGPGTYTKYSNGVAVVIVKAIITDPETGEESSYWPERFPLDNTLLYKGKRYPVAGLSNERHLELTEKGATFVRGLRDLRERKPVIFKAMYQQERDRDYGGDFTQATLELSRDPDRSYEQVFPHELVNVGVDPARTYGAAWGALAVDRRNKTVTVADWWWGENLGYTGIKHQLIAVPITRHNPVWLCYEDNAEGAILDDDLVKELIRESGVSVYPHHTGGRNRASADIGPGAMAVWMRSGQFKLPYKTAEDKARTHLLEAQFKAWDRRPLAVAGRPGRSRPGRAGHEPDDAVMAIWPAWIKSVEMIGKDQRNYGIRSAVPPGVIRRFERLKKEAAAARREPKERRVGAKQVGIIDTIAAFTRQDVP